MTSTINGNFPSDVWREIFKYDPDISHARICKDALAGMEDCYQAWFEYPAHPRFLQRLIATLPNEDSFLKKATLLFKKIQSELPQKRWEDFEKKCPEKSLNSFGYKFLEEMAEELEQFYQDDSLITVFKNCSEVWYLSSLFSRYLSSISLLLKEGNVTNLRSSLQENQQSLYQQDFLPLSNMALWIFPSEIGENFTALTKLVLKCITLTCSWKPKKDAFLSLKELEIKKSNLKAFEPENGAFPLLEKFGLLKTKLRSYTIKIGTFPSLKELGLHSNINLFQPEKGSLLGLKRLYVVMDEPSTLSPEVSNFTSLEYLTIAVAHGQSFPTGLVAFPKLRELILVVQFPSDFLQNGCETPKPLAFPPWILQSPLIEKLGLICSLESLPDQFDSLTKLQDLTIQSEDLLSTFPSQIQNYQTLTAMDLSSNSISLLPPRINQFVYLIKLNLGVNNLKTLPPEIGQCTTLQKLVLSYNQLGSLPPEIGQCTTLQKLVLSHNLLGSLPPEIGRCIGLKTLIVKSNNLLSVPSEVGQCTNLTELNFRDNQIESIPSQIENCSQIIILKLDNNRLRSFLLKVSQWTRLENLSLGANKLDIFLEAKNCLRLRELNLDSNRLTTFPRGILSCTKLEELDISNNKIQVLPPELKDLSSLTSLNISGNPLNSSSFEMLDFLTHSSKE